MAQVQAKPSYDNYIVTTGDISDFDGFLALPIYKKKAAEMVNTAVVFIMNYPAYFGVPKTNSNINGKSHGNTITNLKNKTTEEIQSYKRLYQGKGYGYSAEKLFEFQGKTNGSTKEEMKNLALRMCTDIWNSISGDVKLFFVDGGVNEINPFSIDTIKNEFNVYIPFLPNKPIFLYAFLCFE